MSKSIEEILQEREWNYYFDVDTKVTIDNDTNPPDDPIKSFYPYNLKSLVGKEGIVKKVGWDIHAFGNGKSHNMDVEFDGKIYTKIPAYYLKEYIKDKDDE